MTSLRIGFDMDGTLADLASAYAEVENRLFGAATEEVEPEPEEREAEQKAEPGISERRSRPRDSAYHRDRVWRTIEATANFWMTLKPIDESAIKRLYRLTGEYSWEVFFITQRPATEGGTVQWQTHKWLVDQGFLTPSVIPLSGGRGKAAAALRLDYLVDDTAQNCIDVLADSKTRAILLVPLGDALAESSARRLGIGTAHHIHEVLDVLVQVTEARENPSLFEKIRNLVGWT
jgi:5' nucleotidase, deoxy (Pyrimidine), cytosolic type C protein (NT5C)